MHNFVFHNPTKVIFGKETLDLAGAETCYFGNRVLLVSGVNSARSNGILHQVEESLHCAGAKIIHYDGVQANPTVSHVRNGIQLAQKQKVDVICALGGGSVIDSAKAISAGMMIQHDVWKFFNGKKSVRCAAPLVAISTMAASGSEMNHGMVLTNEETQQKFGFGHRFLIPKVAIMNPETTYTVSPEYTAYGAVDAFSHLLECYMTTTQPGTIVQDRYMEGLAQAIIESCNKACVAPDNYEARSALMWSAALSLNGLAAAGLGKIGFPMHLIEHSLSGLYPIAHGAGLGSIIPGWLRYQSALIPDRIAQFFERVFHLDTDGPGSVQTGISRFEEWLHQNNVPSCLEDVGLHSIEIPKLATNAQPLAKVWRMRDYNQEKIESILHHCLR